MLRHWVCVTGVLFGLIGRSEDNVRKIEEIGAKPAGEMREDNGLKMKFIWCPPGRFLMGTPVAQRTRPTLQADEGPAEVEITHGYWMAQTEVTQLQWSRVTGTQPFVGKFNVMLGDDCPASFVSWNGARRFCDELTRVERNEGRLPLELEYSLPTEAEWEYACRSGTKTKYSFGDDDGQVPNYAWRGRTTFHERYPHRVALKPANSWGLFDMHGNVSEWCLDIYSEFLPGGRDPIVETGITGDRSRITRGGDYLASFCHSAARNAVKLNIADSGIGFRPAIVPSRNLNWPVEELTVKDSVGNSKY